MSTDRPGVVIQSTYAATAAETIAAACDATLDLPGDAHHLIEVPRDQVDGCLEEMRARIAGGRMPARTDPADAERIVRQGALTHLQARHLATAGRIEAVSWDDSRSMASLQHAVALSFAVAFARSRWRGNDHHAATREAVETSLLAGGATWIAVAATVERLGHRSPSLRGLAMKATVKGASHTSAAHTAVHRLAVESIGRTAYGAAAVNHASKLLRTGVVAGTVATVVSSTPDVYRAVLERSISWRQLTKNVSVNVASIASGTAGWLGGAAVGATVGSAVPVIGTAIGGVVGGIVGAAGGGLGGSAVAKRVADRVVQDDRVPLMAALKGVFQELAAEYLLTEEEVDQLVGELRQALTPKWFRHLFKRSSQGRDTARVMQLLREDLTPRFEKLVRSRPLIRLPEPASVWEAFEQAVAEQALAGSS